MANEIPLDILVRLDKSINDIQKFREKTESSLESIQKSANAISFLAIGKAALSAFGGIQNVISTSIHAFEEMEHSQKKLVNSLRLTGEETEINIKNFNKLADSLAEVTKFDDDAIRSQIGFVKQLGATNKETEAVITTATELASALEIDLGTAVEQLTATYGANIRGLGRLFPELKNLTKEQFAAGAAVDIINNKLKGTAKEGVEGFGGALIQAKKAFGELTETFGKFIVERSGLDGILKIATEGFKALENAIKNLPNLAEPIIRISAALATLFIISKLPAIIALVSAAIQFVSINMGLMAARGVSATTLLSGGFKALTASINFAKIAINLFKAAASIGITLIIDQLVQTVIQANNVGQFFTLLANKIKFALLVVLEVILEIQIAYFNFLSKIPGAGKLFKVFSDGIDSLREKIVKLKDVQGAAIDKIVNENSVKQMNELSHATDNASGKAKGLGSAYSKALDELKEKLKPLLEKLRLFGLTDSDKIKKEQSDQLKIIEDGFKAKLISEKQYLDAREAINKEAEQNLAKINKANAEARKKQIEDLASKSTVSGLFKNRILLDKDGNPVIDASAQAKFNQDAKFSEGAGLLNQALKGAQGATNIMVSEISNFAEKIIPGLGAVAGEIFTVLSQSPEKINEMVTAFIQSIPVILENVLLSVPAIIDAIIVEIPRAIDKFIEETPRIIDSIIQNLPHIAISLATMMPMVSTKLALEMPKVAVEFATALVRNVPEIVRNLVDEIKKQISSLGGLLGGGGGGGIGGAAKTFLTGGLNKIFKFAEGGVVPGGFLNDTYPALLTSGEAVIDRSVSSRLLGFLDKAERGGTADGGTQNIVINLQVGEKELADVILSLNRNGFRTS